MYLYILFLCIKIGSFICPEIWCGVCLLCVLYSICVMFGFSVFVCVSAHNLCSYKIRYDFIVALNAIINSLRIWSFDGRAVSAEYIYNYNAFGGGGLFFIWIWSWFFLFVLAENKTRCVPVCVCLYIWWMSIRWRKRVYGGLISVIMHACVWIVLVC